MTELKSSDEYYKDLLDLRSQTHKMSTIGIYHFHPSDFREIGYILPLTFGKWTGKYGIKNLDDFKNSQLVQEIAFRERLAKIWAELKDYRHYEGRVIKDITITKSGMLTAGFYVGSAYLKKFLDTSGESDMQDKFEIRGCSDYMQKFAGYEIDYSITDLDQQRREECKTQSENTIKSLIASLESCDDKGKEDLIIDLKMELFEEFAILMSKYVMNSRSKTHEELIRSKNKLNITYEIIVQIIEQGHAEIDRVFKRELLGFVHNKYSKELAITITSEDELKSESVEIAKKLDLGEMLGYAHQLGDIEMIKGLDKIVQKVKFKKVPDNIREFIKKEDAEIGQKLEAFRGLGEVTNDLKKAIVESIVNKGLLEAKLYLDNCRAILVKGCIEINRQNSKGIQDFTNVVGKIEYDLEKWGESIGVNKSDQDDLSLAGDFYIESTL